MNLLCGAMRKWRLPRVLSQSRGSSCRTGTLCSGPTAAHTLNLGLQRKSRAAQQAFTPFRQAALFPKMQNYNPIHFRGGNSMPWLQRKEGQGGPTQGTQSWERDEQLSTGLVLSFHHRDQTFKCLSTPRQALGWVLDKQRSVRHWSSCP